MRKNVYSSLEKSPDTSNFDWSKSISDTSKFDLSFNNASKSMNKSYVHPKSIRGKLLKKNTDEKNDSLLNLSNLRGCQRRKFMVSIKADSIKNKSQSKGLRRKNRSKRITVKKNLENFTTKSRFKLKGSSELKTIPGNDSSDKDFSTNKENLSLSSDYLQSSLRNEILQPCMNLSPLVGNNEVFETVGKRKSTVMFPLSENKSIEKLVVSNKNNVSKEKKIITKKKAMKYFLYKNVLTKEAFKINKNNKRQRLVIESKTCETKKNVNVDNISKSYDYPNDSSINKSININTSFNRSIISNRKSGDSEVLSKKIESLENENSVSTEVPCVDSNRKISGNNFIFDNTPIYSFEKDASVTHPTTKSIDEISPNLSKISIKNSILSEKLSVNDVEPKELREVQISSRFDSISLNDDCFDLEEKQTDLDGCTVSTERNLIRTSQNKSINQTHNLNLERNLIKSTSHNSAKAKFSVLNLTKSIQETEIISPENNNSNISVNAAHDSFLKLDEDIFNPNITADVEKIVNCSTSTFNKDKSFNANSIDSFNIVHQISKFSNSDNLSQSHDCQVQNTSNLINESFVNHQNHNMILSISNEHKNSDHSRYNLRGKYTSIRENAKDKVIENSISETKEFVCRKFNDNINVGKQESYDTHRYFSKIPTFKNYEKHKSGLYNKKWNTDLDETVFKHNKNFTDFIQDSTSDFSHNQGLIKLNKTSNILNKEKNDSNYYNTIDENCEIKIKNNSKIHQIMMSSNNKENSKTDINYLTKDVEIVVNNTKSLFLKQNSFKTNKFFLEKENLKKLSVVENPMEINKSQTRYYLRDRSNKTKNNKNSIHNSNTDKTKSTSKSFRLVNYEISTKNNSYDTTLNVNNSKIITCENQLEYAILEPVNNTVDHSSFNDSNFKTQSLEILIEKSIVPYPTSSNLVSFSESKIQIESPFTVNSSLKNLVNEKLPIVEQISFDDNSENRSPISNYKYDQIIFNSESKIIGKISNVTKYSENGTQTKKSKILQMNNRKKVDRETQCQLSLCKTVESLSHITCENNNIENLERKEIDDYKNSDIKETNKIETFSPTSDKICNELQLKSNCEINQRFDITFDMEKNIKSYLESTRLINSSKKPKPNVNLSPIKIPNSLMIEQTGQEARENYTEIDTEIETENQSKTKSENENKSESEIENEIESESENSSDSEIENVKETDQDSSIGCYDDSDENANCSESDDETIENSNSIDVNKKFSIKKKQYGTIIEETENENTICEALPGYSQSTVNVSKLSEKSQEQISSRKRKENIDLSNFPSPIKCEDKRVKFILDDDFIEGFSTFIEKNESNKSFSFISPTDPIVTTEGISFRGLGKRTRAKAITNPFESIVYDGDRIRHRKIYPCPNIIKERKARLMERKTRKLNLSKYLTPSDNGSITICNPQSKNSLEEIKVLFEKTDYSDLGLSMIDSICIPKKDFTEESVNNQSQTIIQMIPIKQKESISIALISKYKISFNANQKINVPRGIPYRLYNPNNQMINIILVISHSNSIEDQ